VGASPPQYEGDGSEDKEGEGSEDGEPPAPDVTEILPLANELLRLRKHDSEIQGSAGRVKQIRERVENALQRTRQLDL